MRRRLITSLAVALTVIVLIPGSALAATRVVGVVIMSVTMPDACRVCFNLTAVVEVDAGATTTVTFKLGEQDTWNDDKYPMMSVLLDNSGSTTAMMFSIVRPGYCKNVCDSAGNPTWKEPLEGKCGEWYVNAKVDPPGTSKSSPVVEACHP